MLRFFLKIIVSASIIVSCNNSDQAEPRRDSSTQSISLNKPPVDGSTLRLYNISVAKVKYMEIWHGSLNYEADGHADYVAYKACHETSGRCFEGKSAVNRVIMPPFNGGNIIISGQACVDPGRSTTQSLCGPITHGTFLQPANANSTKAELLATKAFKTEQLNNFGAAVKKILETYQTEVQQCQIAEEKSAEVTARKQMVGAFVALGEALISTAVSVYQQNKTVENNYDTYSDIENMEGEKTGRVPIPGQKPTVPTENTTISRAQTTTTNSVFSGEYICPYAQTSMQNYRIVNNTDLTPVSEAARKSAQKLRNFRGYSNVTACALSSVGLFPVQPVSAIQSLASSVFDMFNADKVQRFPCLAERKASSEMDSIKLQIEKLRSDIAAIDNELAKNPGAL
ncbi:MAG: hypothetical protein R3B45_08605 [Bdellovibrionota bacterium]